MALVLDMKTRQNARRQSIVGLNEPFDADNAHFVQFLQFRLIKRRFGRVIANNAIWSRDEPSQNALTVVVAVLVNPLKKSHSFFKLLFKLFS